jgi:hypothetical protein
MPLEPPPTQTDARTILTIWPNANGHDASVSCPFERPKYVAPLEMPLAKLNEAFRPFLPSRHNELLRRTESEVGDEWSACRTAPEA